VIGGQHNAYLRAQLLNWRSGERGNSPGGMMNKAAKSLTDAEIEALSDYLSGL
jgi:cytochrome c553